MLFELMKNPSFLRSFKYKKHPEKSWAIFKFDIKTVEFDSFFWMKKKNSKEKVFIFVSMKVKFRPILDELKK